MSDAHRYTDLFTALEHARVRAMAENDTTTLDRLLHEDLVYGHANGLTDDKPSYLRKLRAGEVRYADPSVLISKVDVRGSCVLVYVHVTMTVMLNNAPRALNNRVLAVWSKDGEYWKMLAHHPTPVAFNHD